MGCRAGSCVAWGGHAGPRALLQDGTGAAVVRPRGGTCCTPPLPVPLQASGTRHPQRRDLCGARETLPGTPLRPRCAQHLLCQHAGHQMEGQECRGPPTPTGASLPGGGGQRDGWRLVLGGHLRPSLLAVSTCRSTLWPSGPCCSTCTQVSLWAPWGQQGGGVCPAADPAVASGPPFTSWCLSPAVWCCSSCLLGGLGGDEPVCPLRKHLPCP